MLALRSLLRCFGAAPFEGMRHPGPPAARPSRKLHIPYGTPSAPRHKLHGLLLHNTTWEAAEEEAASPQNTVTDDDTISSFTARTSAEPPSSSMLLSTRACEEPRQRGSSLDRQAEPADASAPAAYSSIMLSVGSCSMAETTDTCNAIALTFTLGAPSSTSDWSLSGSHVHYLHDVPPIMPSAKSSEVPQDLAAPATPPPAAATAAATAPAPAPAAAATAPPTPARAGLEMAADASPSKPPLDGSDSVSAATAATPDVMPATISGGSNAVAAGLRIMTPPNVPPTEEDWELAAPITSVLDEALSTSKQLSVMLEALDDACWLVCHRHPDITLLQVTAPQATASKVLFDLILHDKYAPMCMAGDPVVKVLTAWTGAGPQAMSPQPLATLLQDYMPDVWDEVQRMAAASCAAGCFPHGLCMHSPAAAACRVNNVTAGVPCSSSLHSCTLHSNSVFGCASAQAPCMVVSMEPLVDLAQLLLGAPLVHAHQVLANLDRKLTECVAWWNTHFALLLPRPLLMQLAEQMTQLQQQLGAARAQLFACLSDVALVEEVLCRPLVAKP